MTSLRSYALVTGAYWGFTITDGALRMLVVLHFYRLGYGFVQAAVPEMLHVLGNKTVDGSAASAWAFVLVLVPASLALALRAGMDRNLALMLGLAVFAVIFAVNSAVHSYLVLAYTDEDSVALNVGFYYMANAAGRLLGTLASGVVFQLAGFAGCLWGSAALVLAAAVLSLRLPKGHAVAARVWQCRRR